MIQYQILQIDIIRIVWQTVRRITIEIMGVTSLSAEGDIMGQIKITVKQVQTCFSSKLYQNMICNFSG